MEPDFEVGGGDDLIAGWQSGGGQAVLVLHGGPGLSEYTESLLPELVDAYTVIRYQQRGLPPSTTSGPFGIGTQVQDVLRVIDALKLVRPLVLGHSWGGHLAMHLLAASADRVAGALIVDPLGAVGDGGAADLDRILGERAAPAAARRAHELDQKAMRGEGSEEDAIEGLSLVWPGYFGDPAKAPPMPPMRISLPAYAKTFESIQEHFERGTLVSRLPEVQVPTHFLLGEMSPIPPLHGLASASLIPGADAEIVPGCGHFPWLERKGSVRSALDRLAERSATTT
ncbi:MAG: alpha/beta hydrolase [Candidatus Dormiibacterota bacterium]